MVLVVESIVTVSTKPYLSGTTDDLLATISVTLEQAGVEVGSYAGVNVAGLWTCMVTDVLSDGVYDIIVTADPIIGPSETATGTLEVNASEDSLNVGEGPGSDTINPMRPPDMPIIPRTW